MVPRFPCAAALAAVSLACCVGSPPAPLDPAALLPVLRALPAAAVALHLAPLLAEKAPELVAVLDVAPADGTVTLDELAAGFTDPNRAPALAVVALVLIERAVRRRD